MHADSIYITGSTHATCQDYAAHWCGDNYCIAAVSDGCSSSPKSCVGARILVETLGGEADVRGAELFKSFGAEATDEDRNHGLTQFRRRIQAIRAAIGIPDSAFDATLLACITTSEKILLLVWGDGHVRIEHDDGTATTLDIDYNENHNAPYYPGYEIFNPERAEDYRKVFGNPIPSRVWKSDKLPEPQLADHYPIIELPADGILSVSIFSDGAASFLRGRDPIPTDEITKQCCEFKSTEGQLVNRRINKCRKNWRKEDIQHFDDFGMATVLLQERVVDEN